MMRSITRRALAAAILVLAGAFVLPGCGDDDEPTGPQNQSPATQFTGVFAGGADGGRADVTIMTADLAPGKPGVSRTLDPAAGTNLALPYPVTALATLSPTGGGTANLTGTYDTVADTLNLSGSGYAIRGIRTGSSGSPELLGSILGPNGTAGMRCVVDGAGDVSSFCSAYESSSTSRTGRFNFFISGTDIGGVAVETGASAGAWLNGTATASLATRNLAFSGGFAGGFTISVTGVLTVATGSVLGTWTLLDNGTPIDSGSWSGDECLPGTTGPN